VEPGGEERAESVTIRWTRSARIAPGKMLEAMQFGKEICGLVKKLASVPEISVYMDSFGQVGTIRWFIDYKDMADMEKVGNQLLANTEYLEKVNKSADLFIAGSLHDTVMRAI
jgi:hypothetical protein